ncbi:hypothetical protein LIN78_05205 [Leeia sp. TBRC 13508]|uniref:Uncharacterized protein n=1 Tax=Leeia speluncae TaxID=2884804 RepID=A0ABS8D440_9NEIS|nr:hypothetical protein [Leeia speluncae]MCB6182944.1 hypothetical protein [Leeia speluncae]
MPTSIFARVAFLAMSVFWTASGWYFLWAGQLQHCISRCHSIIVIEGPSVFLVSFIFLMLGFIAALVFIRSFTQNLILQVFTGVATLGLPLLYWLFR